MKVFTPEISWHQKKPVFGVDFCKNNWKLASAGGDFTVKIWQLKIDEKEHIGLDFLSDLDRHDKAVNVVKFSPDGEYLASAGDDCIIIIWKLVPTEDDGKAIIPSGEEETFNKETWVVHKTMRRGHLGDIYDLAWSPDGTKLISGSIDNSAIVWNVNEGQFSKILSEHKHFVQGVCWDPRGSFYASLSSDRTCRLYDANTGRCIYSIAKNSFQVETEEGPKKKNRRLFLDEEMQLFFRRCTFSPDGSLLVLPGGFFESSGKMKKTTYVFSRKQFNKPIYHLPSMKKAATAVCFCPLVFELTKNEKEDSEETPNLLGLPYRQIFAVLSLDSLLLYDTQHYYPFGVVKHVHLSFLTDITWSSDGRLLVLSSEDGYCSIVYFSENELGIPVTYNPVEYQIEKEKLIERRKQAEQMSSADQSKSCVDNIPTNLLSPRATNGVKELQKTKEKASPKASPGQQTLEMLVMSSKKRKRPKSASPPTDSQDKVKKRSPQTESSAAKQSLKAMGATGSPRSTNSSKPPRRVNLMSEKSVEVINIIDDDVCATSPSSTKPVDVRIQPESTKPDKRVELLPVNGPLSTVALKEGFKDPTHSAKIDDTNVKTSERNSGVHKSDNTGITGSSKAPKRVTLITLNSDKSKQVLEAPLKAPKRMQIVELSSPSCTKNVLDSVKDVNGEVKSGEVHNTHAGSGEPPQTQDESCKGFRTPAINGTDFIGKNNFLTNATTDLQQEKNSGSEIFPVDSHSNNKDGIELQSTSLKKGKVVAKAPKRVALCTIQMAGTKSTNDSATTATSKSLPVTETRPVTITID